MFFARTRIELLLAVFRRIKGFCMVAKRLKSRFSLSLAASMANPVEQTAMAMFQAVQSLTEQNKVFMERIAELTRTTQTGANQGGRAWDHPDRYRNVRQFSGDPKEWEEFRVKFRRITATV